MFHPVNNLALTLSDVPLKNFVRENTKSSLETKTEKKFKLNFKNEEAKQIYDEIVSHENKCELKSKETILKSSKNKSKTPSNQNHRIESAKTNVVNVNTLFKAIESGDMSFISENFSARNVNITDQFGWTPLMSAAYSGHAKVVDFLLKLGANTKATDKSGFSATDLALKKNYVHISDLIKLYSYNKIKTDTISNSSESDEKTIKQTEFYCDICERTFTETSRAQHGTSVLHIFNTKPKLQNAYYLIPKHNRGYQMLLDQGWDEEKGLGPAGEGQKYPIKTVLKKDRVGLGNSDKKTARVTHSESEDNSFRHRSRSRQKAWNKKDRKKQLSKDAKKTRALRQALS